MFKTLVGLALVAVSSAQGNANNGVQTIVTADLFDATTATSVPMGQGYYKQGHIAKCDEDPKGLTTTYGDGSACRKSEEVAAAGAVNERCALYGNLNLQLCESQRCTTHPTTFEKHCCPYSKVRMWTWGDGSACRVAANNGYRCALWGNGELEDCSELDVNMKPAGIECPPGGFNGQEVCCPPGQMYYGDGSACRPKSGGSDSDRCALWGNYKLPRCPDAIGTECTVIPPGYEGASKTVCCPQTDIHVGDGSACRHQYAFNAHCALYGNGRMKRCTTSYP